MEKQTLSEKEKEDWLWFHENAYKEDLRIAEKLMIESPRWSIVAGYYAMHDLTKLYLGKIKGWKISGELIHSKAIELLSEALKEQPEKGKVLRLIKEAEKEIDETLRLHENTVISFLRAGRTERGKAQYYSENKDRDMFNINFSKKAAYFLDKIVKPYLKIMKGLL